MAEQIPYSVASSLINRLASAAFREFGRIYGVMDEMETLRNTVESIKAVLLDAEEKQHQSHAIQNWIRRLKDEVLYPADDLLDNFLIEDMKHKNDEAPKNKVTQVLHSLSPHKIAFRHKMAHKIEKIQKHIKDVVKDMSGFKLNTNVAVVFEQQSNNVKRETSSFVLASDIIGRKGDKKEIINMLKQPNENQNVSVIAIVGIGGLGKTALAQLVYNDEEVENLFEQRMWVYVSDNFNVKTIVKKMLESLTEDIIDDKLSLDNLQKRLHDNLTGKRYLLILDDIWNENFEKWAQLRTYLMCGAQGSKIVVTTRSKVVAHTMGVSLPYTLNCLTPKKSWNLLNNIITYGNETKCVNQTLESIGMKIAEKCRGVPLAIRSLGGLLQCKSDEDEWIDVLRGEFWKMCEDEDSIMPVLKLSYQNLSPQQRQCFAYCSLFPKGSEIAKDELIKMWMAQGYLDCSVEGQCMEDVGNQFVNIFLMKSFFQDTKMNRVNGDAVHFKMHDLMHDLAIQVAGNDCCYLDSKAKRCLGRPMHVSMEFDALCLLQSLDASRLRTLILFSSKGDTLFDKDELSIILTFKYLRVLKVGYSFLTNYQSLYGSIDKLKHLRYLSLWSCDGLESLSKCISNLVCLQTIKLTSDKEKEDVLYTKSVSKVVNLKHIQIHGCTFRDETPVESGKLSKQHPRGVIFSKWLSSLTNIIEISLTYCRGLQYLPPLERLPFLKSLYLARMYNLEYIYYDEPILHESFYPSLENLHIWKCKEFRGWKMKEYDFNDVTYSSSHLFVPHFPCLSKLTVGKCEMLTDMPTFPNIRRLNVHRSSGKIYEATLNIPASQCLSGSPPFSMLKSFKINDTVLDVMKFPYDWLRNLTSLENLDFYYLSDQHFQEIKIWFDNDPNCLPSLQKITFYHCYQLKVLPDWICNLVPLQHIEANYCRELEFLPEGMPRLTNLRTLQIICCPLLVKECRTETSATWPKIAHIPNIILK